ncbi:MAG TPA: sigma-70 family RNA polymerase sigma factor [Gemmataceae bacterium]|nr:sigma-70 family RNA polymerase sigma factor [Gemmataceae bacterium]
MQTYVVDQLRRTVLLPGGFDLPDAELLDRFIAHHDEPAFAALVKRHGPMVWGVCRRLLHQHDAEDAYQVTFLILARKSASIRRKEMLASWLYGVAHKTALHLRRTLVRRKSKEVQLASIPDIEATKIGSCNKVGELLDEELSRLPDIYRAAIVSCDLEGQTRKVVARRLGIPEGTVAARVARGRAMLAKRLTQRGVTLTAGALATVLAQQWVSAGAPRSLVESTIKAAISFGSVTAAGVSANVITLTEGVLKAMTVSKIKIASMVLFTVVLIGGALATLPQIGQSQSAIRKAEPTTASAGKVAPSKSDRDRLQGRWTVVAVEANGRALAAAEIRKLAIDDVILEADRIRPTRVDPENSLWHGTFKLDERRAPKQITLYDEEADGKAMIFRGIYVINDQTMKWCLNHDGVDVCRPEEFKTKKGSALRIFTFKKVP